MKIKNGKYQIQLTKESNYEKCSSDNKFEFKNHYTDKGEYHPSTQIGIKVYENGSIISSAIICGSGGGSGIHETSQIVNAEDILICCSDHVFKLSIPDLKLYWKINADSATCFQIFKLNQDYIIHGELEISRISNEGKIIWQRSGADIFITVEGSEEDFRLTDKFIFATDWENRKYQFDFNGNEINI